MERQRLFKMNDIERNMLVRALLDIRETVEPGQYDAVQMLGAKTVSAPKGKLYLTEEEFDWATTALNGLRNAYLAAGRSSGGIDKVLMKLMQSKYRCVFAR